MVPVIPNYDIPYTEIVGVEVEKSKITFAEFVKTMCSFTAPLTQKYEVDSTAFLTDPFPELEDSLAKSGATTVAGKILEAKQKFVKLNYDMLKKVREQLEIQGKRQKMLRKITCRKGGCAAL
jgi:hypothetical protein